MPTLDKKWIAFTVLAVVAHLSRPALADPPPPPQKPSRLAGVTFNDLDYDGVVDLYVSNQFAQAYPVAPFGASATRGIMAVPADQALRAQLKLPTKQGLVVSHVTPKSPAAAAGIRRHDVLLTVDGKAVSTWAHLQSTLRKADKKPAQIELLRAGQRIKAEVEPAAETNVWIDARLSVKQDYLIGIHVAAVDATLRSHLALPQGEGLVITQVYDDTPAAKAGLKVHDVLLRIDQQPVARLRDLQQKLRASQGKELSVELIRKGERRQMTLKPAPREGGWFYGPPGTRPASAVFYYSPYLRAPATYQKQASPVIATPPSKGSSEYSQVLKQLKELGSAVDSLRELIEKQAE